MLNTPTPRLDYVDAQWAHGVLDALEQDRTDILAGTSAPDHRLSQLDSVMLAEDCHDIGMLKYALGHQLGEVREALAEAARAYLHVFELRGTQPAFEVTVISDQGAKPLHEPGATDMSLTNSRRGLRAIYISLVAGDETMSREIAAHVWDPPDATSIGPDSEVCTPDDQQLAYVLKALLIDRRGEALKFLFPPPASSAAQAEAALIEMLITRREQSFLARLKDLLVWHHQQVADAVNQKSMDLFFSVPALALCRKAMEGGLVRRAELPGDDLYLPLDLLDDQAGGQR